MGEQCTRTVGLTDMVCGVLAILPGPYLVMMSDM